MSELLVRTYPAELVQDSDGRTLHGQVIPYDQPAKVSDFGGPPYQEVFARGAFKRAVRAPQRVLLRFEHRDGLLDVCGYGDSLEDREDGLWGSFRTLEGPSGEQALELHRAGVLGYFSVGFHPLSNGRRQNGVVLRTHCHLDEVSLCREAAYPGTEAAVRAKAVLLEPPKTDPELERRLAALGYERSLVE
jgi:Escherichia/Staphylococcus phage prohead protease